MKTHREEAGPFDLVNCFFALLVVNLQQGMFKLGLCLDWGKVVEGKLAT